MQPVIYDCMPAMADVFSGAIPRPIVLRPGDDVATWARSTASILRLANRWGLDAATVRAAQSTDDELADFLGDFAAWVTFGGRLVALNVDGTRCAMRE